MEEGGGGWWRWRRVEEGGGGGCWLGGLKTRRGEQGRAEKSRWSEGGWPGFFRRTKHNSSLDLTPQRWDWGPIGQLGTG